MKAILEVTGGSPKSPSACTRVTGAYLSGSNRVFPGGRLYDPYHHSGRSYYQWMARGKFLREVMVPLLDHHLSPSIDEYAFMRYAHIKERYNL